MRLYYRANVIYALSGVSVTLALHTDFLGAVSEVNGVGVWMAQAIINNEVKILILSLPLVWWLGRESTIRRLRTALLVGLTAILFQIGFFFLKSAIPKVLPFYADPHLAELDRMLLFGYDAWQIAQMITPEPLVLLFPTIYLTLWTMVAYAFPIVVAANDPDETRMRRYLWLFFVSWILIGNLLALVGSSVGPVYYDQLLGTNRFDDMRAALEMSPFSSGPLAALQARLWESSSGALSFISAFPSMHVTVAAIVAFYLHERFPRAGIISYAFPAMILLISVYSGYHYLIDGIVGAAIAYALNRVMKARMKPAAPEMDVEPD